MKKQKNIKKINFFFLSLLFFVFLFSPIASHKAHAGIWGEAIVASLKKQVMEEIYDNIKGIMLSVSKQAAIEALNEEVNSLVSGSGSSGARFITNWEDFLVRQPEQKTQSFINDYISQTTGGRGSLSGYAGADEIFGEEGFYNQSYASELEAIAMNIVEAQSDENTPEVTYYEDPNYMFDDGTFRKLNLYLGGINNPFSYSLDIQKKYQEELEKERFEAQTYAIANQGFLGTSTSGNTSSDDLAYANEEIVTYPGILLKEKVANVENLGNEMIVNATHIQEIIPSIANKLLSETIKGGFNTVQSQIQKEFGNIQRNVTNEINSSVQQIGPRAFFQ